VNEKNEADLISQLPIQSENIAFPADEMRGCEKCGRANPPTRLNCFYCGAELPIPAEGLIEAKPDLRYLESWEKGYNLVGRLGHGVSLAAAARELGLEVEDLEKIRAAGVDMPLARVEGPREAEVLKLRLEKISVEASIIADEDLTLERVHRRIRSLEFADDMLTATDFNTMEQIAVVPSRFVLIVAGLFFESKTASLEKRKRKRSKLLDRTETSTDEAVLDLYTSDDRLGIRILGSGFDFSCLGANKSLFAADNMPKLLRRLMMTCVNAKLDDSYSEIREALTTVWGLDSRKDFEGLRRSGFGRSDFSNVVTVSNQNQFNRYSRLRRQVL
jgi:hypothetical protein